MSLPVRWFVVRVAAAGDTHADDRRAEALLTLGGRAVHLDGEWWTTHLAEDDVADPDPRWWQERVAREVDDPGVEVSVGWQEHGDWSELWKRGLEPRRIGERWLVTPSWCTPEVREGERVIVVDPGMAFGNAEHGTTRGCLRLLEHAVSPGEHLIDVGAGSAILSIAAALLGAASVVAVEADPLATPSARENVEANGVADRVEVREEKATVETLRRTGPRDGIVANIERGILTPLLPGFHGALREGGWLILSGILEGEWEGMLEAARATGFRLEQVDADGEWRSGHFIRGA